ncbi:MAG: hypothetical protein A2Y33_12630 [Spirochaetes bacterium GWF1_51_8]|nr:MAG: hypothetical protein A2Y33_12630 [Spirochaetes bacterium GWF1_51_8]
MNLFFKTDENIPVDAAELFKVNGFDCESAFSENLKGESDTVILNHCKKENRILITLDMDFSDIRLYPPKDSPGCVILRLPDQSKQSILTTLDELIPEIHAHSGRLSQNLWIVTKSGIRIRGG